MILQKRNKKFIFLILLLLVVVIPGVVSATDITLKEAIEIGLTNNNEIRAIQKNVNDLKRELASIMAQEDWQIKLGADYANNVEDEKNNLVGEVNISKEFPSGLTINPEISISEDDLTPDLILKITQPIFPSTPTELTRSYYKTERELLKAQQNLAEQKTSKILSWLESYLDLSRMIEQKEIYQQGIKKAEDNLEKVLKKQEIGEAGKEEVLTAKLSLKEAKYKLQETENEITEARLSLYQELGLKNQENFNLEAQSQFLDQLRRKADELAGKYLEMDDLDLILRVEQNNYDILANRIDREILEQELEWLKAERKVNLDLSGSYDTDKEEFTISLDLSYDLYDGGQYKLELEEIEAEIEDKLADHNDLYNNLQLQLKQHRNTIDLAKSALEKEKLSLEKSKYEAEVAKQQLEMGLIDYLEYQEEWLDSKEGEINLRSIQDQLLINKLELIKFVNIDELQGVFR